MEAWVIDVTIVNHLPGEIDAAHALKISKYDRRDVRAWVAGQAKIHVATFGSHLWRSIGEVQ